MRNGQLERPVAVANAKREIAARIRPVCTHFCDDEFEAMVQRMAEIDVHFRLMSDWTLDRFEPDGASRSGP